MSTHMSINISLRDEAYNYLKSLKSKNKSFSDVIIEFKHSQQQKGSKETILQFFGAAHGKRAKWDEREKIMKQFREEMENRFH